MSSSFKRSSKPVYERKPVPITVMPEALDYVSQFQQAEFEERLLVRNRVGTIWCMNY